MPAPTALAYDNRDVAYKVMSPFYDVLARFVPRAVTPNQLTLAGLACAVALAVVMTVVHDAWACWVAAALVFGYEVFDSLDGKHARNTGQSSRFGAYLDTSVDGLAAGLIYAGSIAHFGLSSPIFLFAIAIRLAKACIVYASAAETGLRMNPEIGTTVENLTFVTIFVCSALWPQAAVDLAALLPALAGPLAALQVDHLDFFKAGILFAVSFQPFSAVFDVLEVKRMLEADEPSPEAIAG